MHENLLFGIFVVLLQGCKLTVSFLDIEELKGLKYGIEITKKPVLFSQTFQDNILHVSSKYGQKYQCSIPLREEIELKSGTNSSNKGNLTVKAILDGDLEGQCLYYTLGWWTYKVCYKKEITQYHEEHGLVLGNVIKLGLFDTEKEWNKTVAEGKPTGNEYHSQKYVNGSSCELVGKQRETTLKFFCNEQVTNAIVSVDEPETCVYTITVNSKALCKHSLFKPPEKESPREITCSPALTQEQYDKYLKKEQDAIQKQKEEKLKKNTDKMKQGKGPKTDILSNALNSFASGFTSLFANSLSEADEKPKKDVVENDLSNFWKDMGFELFDSADKPKKNLKESNSEARVSEMLPKDGINEAVSPEANVDVTEESETADIMEDGNTMSKGDGMLNSKGKFSERRTIDEEAASDVKENVKRLLSLQEAINEVDRQAAALIKKDKEKSEIFLKHFTKSKQKAEKQIEDFKSLLSRLLIQKKNENNKEKVQALEGIIKRLETNIESYRNRLDRLDKKLEISLKKSEEFEKRYKSIQDVFSGSKPPNKETKSTQDDPISSLNQILKSLRNKNDEKEAGRIATSGEKLEATQKEAFFDGGKDSDESTSKNKDKQIDPILDAVVKMLKLGGGKKQTKISKSIDSESDSSLKLDSMEKDADFDMEKPGPPEADSLPSSKTSDIMDESKVKEPNDKVKVRISRLGSDEMKLIEENEKQEELSGTKNANNRLKKAGKKIENMIKEKLKKAGVDVGANIKIKIITNDGPLSSQATDTKTDFLTDETATKFKDMLVSMLGGGAEKIKEEKRQTNLEDSYKFVWDQDEKEMADERTEKDDSKKAFL